MQNKTGSESRSSVKMLEIDAEQAGQRLDNFLLRQLKGVPKSKVYRIIRKGEVRVNKGRIKPDYKIQAGDIVRIPPLHIPAAADVPLAGQGLRKLLTDAVIYEDKSLLVVNKPSGLAVHGGSGIRLGLIETLRQMRPDDRNLELVHRLDRDTSGCVMIAKKRSMLRYIHEQLRQDKVDKRYLALVDGKWSKRRELVDAPLLKNHLQSGERVVTVSEEGKKSLTRFSVLERFDSATLVEAKPITGRTHQIRVHAQSVGNPLLGDDKYGNQVADKAMRAKGLRRLFLHARCLTFNLPDEGGKLKVEAPLPDDLEQVLVNLRA